MQVNLDTLVDLVDQIDSQDPIDWGMLSIDEHDAVNLIASDIVEKWNLEWQSMPEHDRNYILLATITKLVVENFCLNVKLQSK